MLRGEIWLANLPTANGSIQQGFRPTILASNNMALMHSPVIHVIPLTSRNGKSKLPTHTMITKKTGILVDSTALCEQSMLISKDMLIKKIGDCDFETIQRVDKALAIQFGLPYDINKIIS